MENEEWHKYHLTNYNSAAEFAANGFAYGVTIDGVLASACSAALRCAQGIELNVITLPEYRNKGLAELVAAATILRAIEQDLIPHWDAANERSGRLAVRLGFRPTGSYFTYYLPA
jgi:predicted GNAT family acetyltransferase